MLGPLGRDGFTLPTTERSCYGRIGRTSATTGPAFRTANRMVYRQPTLQIALASLLLVIAAGEVLTRIPAVAGLSANALFSVTLFAVLVTTLAGTRATYRQRMPVLFWLATLWFVARGVSHLDPVAGGQQLLAWAVFAAAVLVGRVVEVRVIRPDRLLSWIERFGCAWALVAIVETVLHRAGVAFPDLTGRATSAMLVTILAVAWARWTAGRRRQSFITVLVVFAAIVIGEARTASLAALVAAGSMWIALTFRRSFPFAVKAIFAGLLFIVITVLVFAWTPAGSRIVSGLVQLPTVLADPTGGVAAGVTQGRSRVWAHVIARVAEAPVLGYGAGAASWASFDITQSERWRHPHNDYLRILHDTGLIGLALLVSVLWNLAAAAVHVVRRARRSGSNAPVEAAAAFGALVGLAALMMTDNVIVYTYVLVPTGLLAGMALARRYEYTRTGHTE